MGDRILIGPAGWHYQDWHGTVYPGKKGRDFSELSYISEYFNTVELNASFYRIPNRQSVIRWIKQVSQRPSFQFSVKLHQQFTHDRSTIDLEQVRAFSEPLQPLLEQDRLATVLVQFPWSLKKNRETLGYLSALARAFASLPLHFEFRHNSWMCEETLAFCREIGAGIVNIDQPVIGQSIPPSAELTSPVAYVRLHGRNYQNWFREGAGRDARYDYLYNSKELEEWAMRIRDLAEKADKTLVIFNNHFKGQAVINSLQMMSLLLAKPIHVPPTLLEAFPALEAISIKPAGQTSFDF
ncbi:DUF72 domain-containing protein [candidate division KSB1 bacterium]|nr:DUF72 domain-containing protein [candidate division KSB1 bacterium]